MANDPMIGQQLDRYEILALLGEGGMGAVYRGRDTVLKRDVALKFMHAQYARKVEFQQRFLNEAQATAQLDHPGIVKVYDYRQDGDYLYIVMEFIAGGNLSQMLQKLRAEQQWLGLLEAVQLVRQVGLALDYAHRKGVLHRDIKPANIMIKPEPADELLYQPVLADLGLARLGEGLGLTLTGASMGTPSYMSPEQVLGNPMDARSDVYSLGILLYELTVGQRPFNVKSLSEAMRAHSSEEPPRPSSLRPGLPAALEQVILRALKKEPDARYQSAAALAGDLGKLEPTIAAVAPPPMAAAGTVPLMTQYQESVLELRGQSLVEDRTVVRAVVDSLHLRSPDGKFRTLPLAAKVVTVGRAGDNTVQLDDTKVSQHHLRIEYEGSRYRVTDLNSRNGTYMGTVKLLSGVPEVWEPQKPLRVGAHHLLLVLAWGKSSTDSATEYESVGSPLRASGLLHMVKPGGQVSVPLVLRNATRQVDYLALVVEGVPPAWVGPLKPANLHPEQQQDATVTLQPPAAPDNRAGDYPVQIYVVSRNTGQKTLVQALTLRVLPVSQMSSTSDRTNVRPSRNVVDPELSDTNIAELNKESIPTGFFDNSQFSSSQFFRDGPERYERIQETLKFYRDHLNKEYQYLLRQADLTYRLWFGCVFVGFTILILGVGAMLAGYVSEGIAVTASTIVVYFIQRVFQQREDHYRLLAKTKNEHLEYGNQWLLVIQSIDSMEDPKERNKRQAKLVDVLTHKLQVEIPKKR